MAKENKEKYDVQHRRINVFRTRKNRLIFYFKQNKNAYYIEQGELRYVQLFFYRYQFALLTALLSYVVLELWWLSIIVWFVIVGLFELWFRLKVIQRLNIAPNFEHPHAHGFIQSLAQEPSKVIRIRIMAFVGIVIVSVIAAFYGEYSPAYMIGMFAIGVFALSQVILLSYVLYKQNKEGKNNE